MSKLSRFLLVCAALSLVAGQAQAFDWPWSAKPEAPAETAPAAATPAAAPTPLTKGTVVETMNSGGYTYVCIEKDGQKRWAAMPPTKVKVGDEVELGGGMEMGNFTSKTLNRTFEQIYFCGGMVTPQGEAAAGATTTGSGGSALPHPLPAGKGTPPAHHMAPAGQGGMPPGHPGMPAAPPAEQAATKTKASSSRIAGKVVETMDGGGYTYAAVEKDGQRSWVAIPPTKLEVGQEVEFVPGFVMNNFTSGALNRTFEAITFSGGVAKPQ